LVENEIGKRLKFLRAHNGVEYCNNKFDYYFSNHGIRREKKVPGTPQENGVSETMNREIVERARSMILHVGFPLHFWEYVGDTIFYLIKKGPSISLDGGIPEEAWIGKKVKYFFLRLSVVIDKENITNIEEKSKKSTFIRYGV
jgi:hypothetical protein